MTRILVLYHSIRGHVERMAEAAAAGAREIPHVEVDIRRVPETIPDEVLVKIGARREQPAPVAEVSDLPRYDGFLFGTGTRYGNMTGQMRTFLDQTGKLWESGALIGKAASVFTSTATQHGGQESTILTFIPTLLHLGMVVVGLPYSAKEQMGLQEVLGGSPYGAATITGSKGERWPSAVELGLARFQGRHLAQIAARLAGART